MFSSCHFALIFLSFWRLFYFYFFSIPGLAFAYSQSPLYLRGVIMGLNLATIGIGFYVAGALAAIVRKASDGSWYPQDLNAGKLENYFFFLAVVIFLNFLVFVYLARRYKYVESSRIAVTVVEDQERTSIVSDRSPIINQAKAVWINLGFHATLLSLAWQKKLVKGNAGFFPNAEEEMRSD